MRGTFFGGTHKQDNSMLLSVQGSPYCGKLPYMSHHNFTFDHVHLFRRAVQHVYQAFRLGSGLKYAPPGALNPRP